MPVVASNMVALGTKAPDFNLMDVVSGKSVQLSKLKPAKATVIAFICNHCPFVKHILPEFVRLTKDYQSKDICFLAISSNDPIAYPEDAPENMKTLAIQSQFSFPYLFDETQQVAKAYEAACTPDFYIFDENLKLVYRGQFDDSRVGNQIPVTGQDIRHALDQLLAGKPVDTKQKPSTGCSIKWRTNTSL